jgi:hypothetical protein
MIVCKFVLPSGGVCNFENPDDAEWCGNCGEKLEWYGEKVVETKPEPAVTVIADEGSATPGIVERVKTALGHGDEEDRPATVATSTRDAPVIVPEAAPEMDAPGAASTPKTGNAAPAGETRTRAEPSAPEDTSLRRPPTDQPKSTLPGQEKGDAKPTVKRPKPPQAKPGDLICGACGLPNDPSRNFCARCGTSLKEAKVAKIPWWRRVFHRRNRSAPIDDSTSSATRPSAGRAPRPRVKNFIAKVAMFALFGTVIAGFAVPSLRSQAIDWYHSALDRLFPNYDPVKAEMGEATRQPEVCADAEAKTAVSDHCPIAAFDGSLTSYWVETKDRAGVEQSLTATFQRPTDLDRIVISIGAPPPDYETYGRPQVLSVTVMGGGGPKKFDFDGGHVASAVWDLTDTADEQQLALHAEGVKRIEFTIKRVYRGQDSSEQTAIRDIEFWQIVPRAESSEA